MFDLNFISEPGMQNETSDASWSFLSKKSEPEMNGKAGSNHSQVSLIHQNSWKNYVFVENQFFGNCRFCTISVLCRNRILRSGSESHSASYRLKNFE